MQHNTYPLGPQNLHLDTPTTVRPKTLDLLSPHTKHHHNPAVNKSEPTSTSCTQHITTQNQNQASNSKPPLNTILSKQQPTKHHLNKQHTQRSTTNTNLGNQQPTTKKQTTQDTAYKCKWHPKQNCRTTTTSYPRKH